MQLDESHNAIKAHLKGHKNWDEKFFFGRSLSRSRPEELIETTSNVNGLNGTPLSASSLILKLIQNTDKCKQINYFYRFKIDHQIEHPHSLIECYESIRITFG